MPEFYDDKEWRPPELRQRELYLKLPGLIARATTAPGWTEQLAGFDPASITSRAALAGLPVLRKSDLEERQQIKPPFGGFNVTAPAKLKRLLMSPGPIFEPEGHGVDWWNAARALFAAGFRGATSCTTLLPIILRQADSFSNPVLTRLAAQSSRAGSTTPSSRWKQSRIYGQADTLAPRIF